MNKFLSLFFIYLILFSNHFAAELPLCPWEKRYNENFLENRKKREKTPLEEIQEDPLELQLEEILANLKLARIQQRFNDKNMESVSDNLIRKDFCKRLIKDLEEKAQVIREQIRAAKK